jgi:nucleoside-diphosphate-sugar epimerase
LPSTLLTGATGFIGGHVARLLVQRGDEVRALIRPGSEVALLEELEVAIVPGDVTDRRSVRLAMAQAGRWVPGAPVPNPVEVPGARQPVALRVAGAFVRRSPLGWF